MPDSDWGFHRKHACLPIHRSQPQFCGFLAASMPDLKQSKTGLSHKNNVDPPSLSFSSMWCSDPVLSWVYPCAGSVSSWKMKTRDPFFPSPLFWVTGRVSLSTEFLCSRFMGPMLELMLWLQELCFCSCTGCCSWLLPLSPLPSCTNTCVSTPGSVWISNLCTSASWRRPEPLPVLLWDY